MRGSNYPDGIRQYDHDPRSPFYRDHRGEAEEAAVEEFETRFSTMLDRMDALGFPYKVDAECSVDEDGYNATEAQITRVCLDTGNEYGSAVDPEDVDRFLAKLGDVPDALDRLTHYFDTGEE